MRSLISVLLALMMLLSLASASAAGQAPAWQMVDLTYGNMVMGRACLPEGYTFQFTPVCSVTDLSIGNPWALFLNAASPDGNIGLTYQSARDYVSYPNKSSYDGQYDSSIHTPLLHRMNAGEYCDYWVKQNFSKVQTIRCIDENTYPELAPYLRQQEQLKRAEYNSASYGANFISDVTFDFGVRLYQLITADGSEFRCAVGTGTQAATFNSSVPGIYVTLSSNFTSWTVPYVYAMFCPASAWDEGSVEMFKTFMANTSSSVQFQAANQRLSNALWDIVNGRSSGYSDNYETQVMQEETSKGDDYDDQFSDYILDRNDYTLSDGTHVKVPSGYDYVYEGDNGSVYFSNSAFGQPGGSTQLYPNQ